MRASSSLSLIVIRQPLPMRDMLNGFLVEAFKPFSATPTRWLYLSASTFPVPARQKILPFPESCPGFQTRQFLAAPRHVQPPRSLIPDSTISPKVTHPQTICSLEDCILINHNIPAPSWSGPEIRGLRYDIRVHKERSIHHPVWTAACFQTVPIESIKRRIIRYQTCLLIGTETVTNRLDTSAATISNRNMQPIAVTYKANRNLNTDFEEQCVTPSPLPKVPRVVNTSKRGGIIVRNNSLVEMTQRSLLNAVYKLVQGSQDQNGDTSRPVCTVPAVSQTFECGFRFSLPREWGLLFRWSGLHAATSGENNCHKYHEAAQEKRWPGDRVWFPDRERQVGARWRSGRDEGGGTTFRVNGEISPLCLPTFPPHGNHFHNNIAPWDPLPPPPPLIIHPLQETRPPTLRNQTPSIHPTYPIPLLLRNPIPSFNPTSPEPFPLFPSHLLTTFPFLLFPPPHPPLSPLSTPLAAFPTTIYQAPFTAPRTAIPFSLNYLSSRPRHPIYDLLRKWDPRS